MRKRINKILWHGDELFEEKAKAPGIATSADGLDGLNEGEIYISNNEKDPALFIRTSSGKVVRVGVNYEELKKLFLSRTDDDTAEGLINFEKGVRIKNLILKVENDVLSLTNIENGKRAHFAASGTVSSLGVGTTGGGGGSSEGGASALYQLLDVLSDGTKVEGAEDGSVLTYDENAGKWKATKIDIPEADLTEIEGQLASIGQLIKTLQGKDTTIEKSVADLQEADKGINASIIALQGKDTEHSNAITALQQKDGEIEAAIGSNTKGIESLQGQLDTLVSGDASDAINSFNEVVAFLKGIEDTSTLEGILAGKQNRIDANNKLDYSLLANTPSLADFMGGSAIGGTASSDNFSAVYWDGKQWQTRTLYKWALAANKPSYTTSEVTEGTRLYFTDARAKDALKSTTDALSDRIAKFEKMFQWGNGEDSYVKTPFPLASDKTVSSLGIGSSEGGGVSYNRLDSWENYTADKAGYVLSAALGYDLKTRLDNLDLGDFDLSGYLTKSEAQNTYATIIALNGKQNAITANNKLSASLVSGLSTVATSGKYSDLSGLPTLGTLASKNSLAASDIPSLSWNKITSDKPTTLSGYGITDALSLSGGQMDRNAGITWDNGYYDSDAVGSHLSVLADTTQDNSLATQTGHTYNAILNVGGGGVDSYRFQLASYATSDNFLFYRGYDANSKKWKNWVEIIHSGNIDSQSVNYATSAGSADKLSEKRAIWGQSFDGSEDVSGNIHLGNDGSYEIGTGFSASNPSRYNRIVIDSDYDGIKYYSGKWTGSNSVLAHQFIVGNTDMAALTIYNSGNVLIGTTTDSGTKLNVHGSVLVNRYAASGYKAGADIVINKSGDWFGIGASASNVGNISIGTTSDAKGTWKSEIATITDSGNISIGTTNANGYKLYVNGNSYVNGALNVSNSVTIGDAKIWWDATNQVLRTDKSFASDKTVSSLGVGSESGGGGGTGGYASLDNVASDVLPSASNTFTIGNSSRLWKAVYANSLYLGTTNVGESISSLQSGLSTANGNIGTLNTRVTNIEGGYLSLDGGTVKGVVTLDNYTNSYSHITFKNNRVGSEGFADDIINITDGNNSTVGSFGMYGVGTVSYYYLGHNSYNGDNLRVYADKLAFGNNTVLHAGNIGDYALPLSGGTIDGTLTVKNNVYIPNIFFNGTETERVLVPYAAYNYDLSYYDGAAWNRIIHSGNIGSQSVASAEMLVSPHSYEYGLTIDNDTTAESLLSESYAFSSMMTNTTWNNNWSTVFTFSGYKQYGGSQIAFDYNGYVARMAIRNYNQTLWNWNSWREVAFVDSNVASASYATSAGNADTLGGLYYNSFYQVQKDVIPSTGDISAIEAGSYWVYENIGEINPVPSTYSSLIAFGKSYYSPQLCVTHNASNAWLRGIYNTSSGYSASDWHELAFTDSNVASATKLATARTIWGQSFDGSGDVSGDLTGLGAITRSFQYAVDSDIAGNLRFKVDGTVWTFDRYNGERLLSVNGNNGNVLIGTTEDNGHKLYVNGNSYVNGSLTVSSSAKVNSLNVNDKASITNTGAINGTSLVMAGGHIQLYKNDDSAADYFTIDNAGNTYIGGTLGVDGAATFGSTLKVTGATTLEDKLTISKNGMSVSGTAYFGGGTSYYFGSSGNVSANTLTAAGATSLKSTLAVTGATTLSSTLGVSGVATFNSNIKAKGYIYFGANDDAYIYWDAGKKVLRTNVSFASDKTVSSLGVGTESGGGGSADWGAVPTSIIPTVNGEYTLGSNAKMWRAFYAQQGFMGGILATASGITISALMAGSGSTWQIATNGAASFSSLSVGGSAINFGNFATTSQLNSYVTLKSQQTIEGAKTFQNGLNFYGELKGYDAESGGDNIVLNASVGSVNLSTLTAGTAIYTGEKTAAWDGKSGAAIMASGSMVLCAAAPRIYFAYGNAASSAGVASLEAMSGSGLNFKYNMQVFTESESYANFIGLNFKNTRIFRLNNSSSGMQFQYGTSTSNVSTKGTFSTSGAYSASSDITKKNILSYNAGFNVRNIAEAPIAYFTWKDLTDNRVNLGSIAQYWQLIAPECIYGTEGIDMTMDYSTLGLVSSIINARAIVSHENEIDKLKRRVEELESENKRLQERVDALVA